MLTAIVSDLHLGTTSGADVARHPAVFERLASALSEADRVVVLGDLLELRERPAIEALELAGPCLEAHRRGHRRQAGGDRARQPRPPAGFPRARPRPPGRRRPAHGGLRFDLSASELAARVAARMPESAVELAYPGVWLRDDVYATHGHYLDLHLTVPRVECVVGSAIGRFAAAAQQPTGADAYEAALAPLYAFAYSVVQGSPGAAITRGNNVSRKVWSARTPTGGAASPVRRSDAVAIPSAVAALNALGLGPFRADISAVELRRAGLRAMADVVRELGVRASHVIFGHTHRAGPLPGDAEGWWLPDGTQLTNTGSWLYEEVFVGADGPSNPYWPGRVTWLGDEGPPESRDALGDLSPAEVRRISESPRR